MIEVTWGTEIALAIFFGGLGGGSFIVASFTSYTAGERFRNIMKFASYIGVIAAMLCIFFFAIHSGHPERALNLYSNFPSSMISFGTTVLSLIILLGIAYASFFIPESLPAIKSLIPWHTNIKARKTLELVMFALGVCLVSYTSFVLALARINAFWDSPLLVILFFASGVSTALMSVGICLTALHRAQYAEEDKRLSLEMMHKLDVADGGMLLLELVTALTYLYTMLNDPVKVARVAAEVLTYGPLSTLFWGGFIGVGVITPAILIALLAWKGRAATVARFFSPLMAFTANLVLIGGILMRYAIVIAGQYPFLLHLIS